MQKTLNRYAQVNLRPHKMSLFLLGTVVLSAGGHILVHLVGKFIALHRPPLLGVFRFFHMGFEGNLPTYFSALNLLLAAGLCGLISFHESTTKKNLFFHWLGMCGLLLFMSFDEASGIHDRIVGPISIYFMGRGEGIMYYRWYLFFIPIVFAVSLIYIPFLKRLPLFFSSRFILAGFVFLSGSIGMEMVESILTSQGHSVGVSILLEETLEMLAVVILIHTLLLYIAKANYTLKLQVSGNPHR